MHSAPNVADTDLHHSGAMWMRLRTIITVAAAAARPSVSPVTMDIKAKTTNGLPIT